MTARIGFASIAFCLAGLTACATNVSPTAYSVGSVGQVNRTVAARVISVRPVEISGTTAAGGTVGAALGAIGGSGAGHSDRSNLAGSIAGAAAGAIVGAALENSATRQSGFEYVVQTENDNLMTIVQGANPTFAVNDNVLVLYGSPARLIPDPRH
jgi:outer membrane lipoprotein SlyB